MRPDSAKPVASYVQLAMYRGWQRYIALTAIVVFIVYFGFLLRQDSLNPITPDLSPSQFEHPALKVSNHPIDHLIKKARFGFKQLLGKRSVTLEQAASRYRERRGRHPPPGFDIWFKAAQKKDAIVVEEFFDRIHHDINPFWALDPHDMRVQTHTQPQVIHVRSGKASWVTDDDKRPPWIQLWTALVEEMLPHLPDLDMVVNVMDETRILVPWEKIDSYVATEEKMRKLIHPDDAISQYSGLSDVDAANEPYEPNWIHSETNTYWDHTRAACPPDSIARNISSLASFNDSIDYPTGPMEYTYKGFVQNFTASQDACRQPHLRGMHGTFIESVSMSTLHELLPMFGGSKLPQNNEILIPGAMYLTDDPFYSGGRTHGVKWAAKKDALVWRGAASGGRNKVDNWWHFHRHRWVQMMNGTTVSAMEAGDESRGPSFKLIPPETYSVLKKQKGKLGQWLSSFADVGFNILECFPRVPSGKGYLKTCEYTDPFMEVMQSVPMKTQYKYKYLPDVDGNSFSARWRGFLLSTSMPLKATIYAEWHDDRMIPWVHFVPFDSSYMDIYGIMDYFLNGHDAEAQRIAEEGRVWAESVYRRDDMMLYVWRLLLEYARVVDDNRERLAFVEDLR
ncbi:lipopolysaccharide-modifying protein [Mollisia scopiformis]|uniref:Lipopolysaccharide-modifying protein n=1 Tax=Mollisia scopiformis TaxID=149040 RepID=A0A194WWL3_MOLSC|nr:lipopolysaccharide-modifying protein [Mollisia scopiformis]KUJ12363.1 lipopolysaccharide-modifying protein [Mollisia scopiformis]